MERPITTMASERCPGCGGFLAEGLELCLPCRASDRERKEQAKAAAESRAASRAKAIETTIAAFPEVIRETEVSRLDERMQKVIAEYDPAQRESWVLFGATRVGKTRTAFMLAKKYSEHLGLPCTFLTMRRFEATIDQSFRDKRHAEALDRLISVPFLVIDDFGKERLTERLAVDLFALIDERTADRRPTVITTNLTGDLLEQKFTAIEPNLAIALVARIREFFRKVAAF